MLALPILSLLLVLAINISTASANYISRPDLFPIDYNITYTAPGAQVSDGYFFLGTRVDPFGLYILNSTTGEPVYISYNRQWLNASDDGTSAMGVFNWRPQLLDGSVVNTFWSGDGSGMGYGWGRTIILDQSYTPIHNISDSPTYTEGASGNTDIHETRLTVNNTLLVCQYRTVYGYNTTGNLSDANGYIVGPAFQEQSLDGTVLFDWDGLERGIDLSECKNGTLAGPGTPEAPFDYAHINSVYKDGLGNYLISVRHTWTIYYVSGADGSILWRLGGFVSDFTDDGTGSQGFSWQHDAQFMDEAGLTWEQVAALERRTISLFDNAATTFEAATTSTNGSSGLIIDLYLNNMTSSLRTRYNSPGGNTDLLAVSQGSLQVMGQDEPFVNVGDSLNEVIMSYGPLATIATYHRNGTALQVVQMGRAETYRSFKVSPLAWAGYPQTTPDVAWAANADGNYTLAVSWNGASEVAWWRVEMFNETMALQGITAQQRNGSFESLLDLGILTRPRPGVDSILNFTSVQVSGMRSDAVVLGKSVKLGIDGTNLGGQVVGRYPPPAIGSEGDEGEEDVPGEEGSASRGRREVLLFSMPVAILLGMALLI